MRRIQSIKQRSLSRNTMIVLAAVMLMQQRQRTRWPPDVAAEGEAEREAATWAVDLAAPG